jgi:hypothetical protein
MALNNGGTINNTSNPTGHSHSIHQITELSAGGITGDMLVYSNDIWIPHDATPYVVASGQYTNSSAIISSIAANGNAGPYAINYETFFGIPTKFTVNPILTAVLSGASGGQQFLTIRTTNASTTGFSFYIYNPRAVASGDIAINGLVVQFHAIQISATANGGMVSRDPSI